MAINKITAPIQPPASDADWSNTQDLIEALALGVEGPLRIVGSNVVRGAVFNIGGSVYIADADTAITGTASKYVKITPSGASATASYVASLTGVTWNSTYNGYYDGSGNLYLFDELLAYASGAITTVYGNRNFNPSTMDRLGLGPGSNAGINSTALGYNNTASGDSSSAVGRGNTASGDYSFAAGTGQNCNTAWETAINKIRYVEFPAGTTHGTIYTKLYALLGSPSVSKHTSVIGDFGAEKLNYLRCLSPRIQIYYGTTDNSIIVSSGSTTTITEGLYMLLVTK